MTRATVFGLMPRKPASSRMLGRAWSGGTPPLSMTCLSCSVSCRRIGIGLLRVYLQVAWRSSYCTDQIVHYGLESYLVY